MAEPSTPTTSRVAATSIIQSSPHYTTTRRHSLYGVEDRVVIDPGSRIWKVGFSGEGRPRAVFYPGGSTGQPLWRLEKAPDASDREEETKLLQIKLESSLRSVFHDSLLTDPKARKIILVEHPLLPIYIKDMIARILFENLQVPSVSFASSHLLALLSVGKITGLVLDCGHLESVALPIFAARPLYPQLKTTPLAGSRLTSHIRSLLLLFGTYLPPPTSLSSAVNIPAANRSTRVPPEVLTDSVIEDIKSRCFFVGESLTVSEREATPGDELSDFDVPPSDSTHSESEFSHLESNVSSQRESSEFSVISNPRLGDGSKTKTENHLQALSTMYTRQSNATDLKLSVVPPLSQQNGTGNGTLIIPGWIRERSAEILFDGGDLDESSVAETILDSLLKVPVDLRKTMASSILVTGGSAMLPGFISRVHIELLKVIASSSTTSRQTRPDRPPIPQYDRYASLRPLVPYLAILNNPNPPPTHTDRAKANAGKAPAFCPALMAWVGGSLAGALKTGGVEVAREKWDEDVSPGGDVNMDATPATTTSTARNHTTLPDWTRIPLPAEPDFPIITTTTVSPQSTRIGA